MSFADKIGHHLLDVRCRAVDSLVFKLQHQLVRPSELAHDSSLFTSLVAHVRSLLSTPSDPRHLETVLRALVLLGEGQPLGSLRIVQSGLLDDLHSTFPSLPDPCASLASLLLNDASATAARGVVPFPSAPCVEPAAIQPIVGLGLNRPADGLFGGPTQSLSHSHGANGPHSSSSGAPGTTLIERERKEASDAQLARIFKYNDPSKAWQQERLSEDIPVDEGGWALRRVALGGADDDLLVDLTLRVQYSKDVAAAAEVVNAVLEKAMAPGLLPAEAFLQHPSLLRCILRLLDVSDRSSPLTTLVLQCSENVVGGLVAALRTREEARPDCFPSPDGTSSAAAAAAPTASSTAVPTHLLHPAVDISSDPREFCAQPDQILCATSALHVIVKALLPLTACPQRCPRVLALTKAALPYLVGPRGKVTRHQTERIVQLLNVLQSSWSAARALQPTSKCLPKPTTGWTRHMLEMAELALVFLELLPASSAASTPLPPLVLQELSDLLQQDVVLKCSSLELQLKERLRNLSAILFPAAETKLRELEDLEGRVTGLTAAVEDLREALSMGNQLVPLVASALESLPALDLVPSGLSVRLLTEAALQSVLESEEGVRQGGELITRLITHPKEWVRLAALTQITEGVAAECNAAAAVAAGESRSKSGANLGPGSILALLEAPGLLEAVTVVGLLPGPEESASGCPELAAQLLLDLASTASSRLLEGALDPTSLFARLRVPLPLIKGAATYHRSSSLAAVTELVMACSAPSPAVELRDELLALFSTSALERRGAVDRLASTLPCQALAPVASDPFEALLDKGTAVSRHLSALAGAALETFTAQDTRNLIAIVRARDLPGSVRKPAAEQLAVLLSNPRLAAAVLADHPDLVGSGAADALEQCSEDLTLASALLEAPLVLALTYPGLALPSDEPFLTSLGCLALCQSSAVRMKAGALLFRVLADSLYVTLPKAVKDILILPPSSSKGPRPVSLPAYFLAVYSSPLPLHVSALPPPSTSEEVGEQATLQRLVVRQILASPQIDQDPAKLATALEEDASSEGRLTAPLSTELRAALASCRFEPLLSEALSSLESAKDHVSYRTGLVRLTALLRNATPLEVKAALSSTWPAVFERLLFNCPANRDDLFLWISALEFVLELVTRAVDAWTVEKGDPFLLQKTLRFLTLAYQRSVLTFLARHATITPLNASFLATGAAPNPRIGLGASLTPRVVLAGGCPPTGAGWGPLEPEKGSALCVAVTLQLLQLLNGHCAALLTLQDRMGAHDLLSTLGAALLPYLTKVAEGAPSAPEMLPSLTLAASVAQLASLAFPEQPLPSALEGGLAALSTSIVRQILVRDASSKPSSGAAAEESEVDRFPGFAQKGAVRAALTAVKEIFAALPSGPLSRVFIDCAATAWISRAARDRESGCVCAALAILTRLIAGGNAECRAYLQRAWPDLQTFLCRLVMREVADRASLAAALQTLSVAAAQFEDKVATGFGLGSLCLRTDLLRHVAQAVLPKALVHSDVRLQAVSLALLSLAASADVPSVATPLSAFVAAPHRPWDVATACAALAADGVRKSDLDLVLVQMSVLTHYGTLTSLLAEERAGDAGAASSPLLQDPFVIPSMYAAAAVTAELYLDPEGLHPDATTGRRIHDAAASAISACLGALSQLRSTDPAQDLAHHTNVQSYATNVAADVRAELRIAPLPAPSSTLDASSSASPSLPPVSFVASLRLLTGNHRVDPEIQTLALSVLSAASAEPQGLAAFGETDAALPSVVAPLTHQYLRSVSGASASAPSYPHSLLMDPPTEDVRYGSVICLRNLLQNSAAAKEAFIDTCLSDVVAEALDAFSLYVLALRDGGGMTSSGAAVSPTTAAKSAEMRREKLALIARRRKQQQQKDGHGKKESEEEGDKENRGGQAASSPAAAKPSAPPTAAVPVHVERATTALSLLLACATGAEDELRAAIANAGAVRLTELLFTWSLECEPLLHWILALCRALLPRNPAAIHAATTGASLSVKGRPLETRGRLLEVIAKVGTATSQLPSVRAACHEVLSLAASSLQGTQAILRLPFAHELPNCLRQAALRKDPPRAAWSTDLLLALASHPEAVGTLVRGPFSGLLDVLVDGLDGTEARPGEAVCPSDLHFPAFSVLCLLGQSPENKAHFSSNPRALRAVASRVSVECSEAQAALATVCLAQLLSGSGGERVKALLRKMDPAREFSSHRLKELRQRWTSAQFLGRYSSAVAPDSAANYDVLIPVLSHVLDGLEEAAE